ncbi:MAG: hypothetical protein IJQ32_05505 [Paludibacteraceae bacterium]|nr:hypothetical protein [Paludibacteraceae bacterium]
MEKEIKTTSNTVTSPITEERKFPCVREVRDLEELNNLGCHYINTANQGNYTRMITRSMRWLTVRDGNGYYLSEEQKRACHRIEYLTALDENNIERHLNLNILLEKDPRHSYGPEYTYIKRLIQIGADVRFVERESKVKLVLQEDELYLSFSNNSDKMVSIGYHYIGKNKADGLCQYIANKFDRQFEKAQKLTIINDKIALESKHVGEQMRRAFHLTDREWAIYVLSIIASIVIGAGLTLFFRYCFDF